MSEEPGSYDYELPLDLSKHFNLAQANVAYDAAGGAMAGSRFTAETLAQLQHALQMYNDLREGRRIRNGGVAISEVRESARTNITFEALAHFRDSGSLEYVMRDADVAYEGQLRFMFKSYLPLKEVGVPLLAAPFNVTREWLRELYQDAAEALVPAWLRGS